jgi:hypothetical protein
LTCRKFRNNEFRLQFHALAYKLTNFIRTLALPEEVEHWMLTTIRVRLVKTDAENIAHGRNPTFQMAEVALPGELFRKTLRRINELRSPAGVIPPQILLASLLRISLLLLILCELNKRL